MARIRSVFAAGAQAGRNAIQQLAQWFRLGQFGAAQPGSQAPARPQLRTIEEVQEHIAAMQLQPGPAGTERWYWSFVCYWEDEHGERVGRGTRQVIEEQAGNNYFIRAANRARQQTRYPADVTQSPPIPTGSGINLRCRKLGNPIIVTT